MSWVWHTKKPDQREPDWNAPLPEAGSSRLEYLYAWERRCRGYEIQPFPVALEPAFMPYAPDDPDALNRLSHVRALPQAASPSLRHIGLQLPLDQKVTVAAASGLLSILGGLHRPLGFEIVATGSQIGYQFSVSMPEAPSVLSSLRMQWSKAAFDFQDDLLAFNSSPVNSRLASNAFVVDFGLLNFSYLPLACFESFVTDPLAGVIAGLGQVVEGQLDNLENGEMAGLQVLFAPARAPWAASLFEVAGEFDATSHPGSNITARSNGRSPLESEAVRSARTKLVHPLYTAVIRVFAVSRPGQATAFDRCKRIGGALGAFNDPQRNGLIALSNNDPHSSRPHSLYPDGVHLEDVLRRTTHRSGLLLSLPELVGFVHPPPETLQHPRLIRLDPNARSLPAHLLEAQGALLGIHRYRSQEQALAWPDAYRNRHAYILGATRMGKSTLLLSLICQDMKAGRGLCLIDPHGDLALDVLAQVPEARSGDVLYLDLSDREYPLALGLLEASNEYEQRLLCSDVLSVLKRLFASSWGDRLEHILRHAILTLLSISGGGSTYTLRDIRPLLSNKAFREQIVAQLEDHDLKSFWTGEFFGYSSSHFAPLYNKLGLLLSSPIVRNIIAQKQSKLSIADVMQNRQVLLINLASSRIGNDNAHFLGALLVSKLQIAAMQSLRLDQSRRTPFTLYVDEFQNFVVSSFETILSEAGKAGLSLVMANQFLEQLNAHLQTAILGNVGTMVSFRVSSDSGRLLEKEFAGRFRSSDLVSLNRGEAVARVGSAQDTFFIETLPPLIQPSTSFAATIREQSQERVCRPRAEVESELAEETARQATVQEAAQRAEEEKKLAAKQAEVERKAEEKAEAKEQAKSAHVKPAQIVSAQIVSAKAGQIEEKKTDRESPVESGATEAAKGIEKQNIEPASESFTVPAAEEATTEITSPKSENVTEETQIIGPSEPECFGVPDE
jgi:hypothetical protein